MLNTQKKAVLLGLALYILLIICLKLVFEPLHFGIPFYFAAITYAGLFFVNGSDCYPESEIRNKTKCPSNAKSLPDPEFATASVVHILALLISISVLIFCMHLNQHEILRIGWLLFILIFFLIDGALLMAGSSAYGNARSVSTSSASPAGFTRNTATDNSYSEAKALVDRVIIEKLGVEPHEITSSARMSDDLGADELDYVELDIAISDKIRSRYGKDPADIKNYYVNSTVTRRYIECVRNYMGQGSRYAEELRSILVTPGDYYELYAEIIRKFKGW